MKSLLPLLALASLLATPCGRAQLAPTAPVTPASAATEAELSGEAREIIAKTLDSSSAEEKADYGVIKEKIRQDLKLRIVPMSGNC